MTPAAHQSPYTPELRAAARHLGRRRFLTGTAAAAALAFTVNLPAAGTAGRRRTRPGTAHRRPQPASRT